MSLSELIKLYFDSKRSAKAVEVEVLKESLQVLNQKLEALERLVAQSQTSKLEKDLNVIKATVEKLSSRLIGFSKTGIS